MRTVVVGDDEPLSAVVREVLLGQAIDCPASHTVRLDRAASLLQQVQPDLVIVLLSPDPDRALAVLHDVSDASAAHVVALGPAADPKLILRTLRDGANEYLDESELRTELDAALQRLRAKNPDQARFGRLIAVLAPSGGSGSSTLAVNVATVLAKEHHRSLLYDLKLEAGDLAALLDLKPTHTLAEFCHNAKRMDRSMFEQLLDCHSSGVHLLAAPRKLSEIAQVNARAVNQAILMGRALFPYVVVDLDHTFREEQTDVLREADVILLVLRLDFTSLRNTRRTLDHLQQIGTSLDHVQLVANRFGQPQELPAAKAEDALGVKLSHYIPDDPKTVNGANNKGIPVVLEKPGAKVSRCIIDLAMSINGQHVAD